MKTLHPLILLFVFAVAVPLGCKSTYDRLVPEDQIRSLSDLKREAEGRPVRTFRYPTVIADRSTVRIAIHDTGDEKASRIVVLYHGIMSHHCAWRFVAGDLGRDHRLVLVDLPGCGESDRPDPHGVTEQDYSPTAMAERVLQALDAHLPPDSRHCPITLVGHSLGGTVVLRTLADRNIRERHARFLRRVDRAVLIAPVDAEYPNPPAEFVRIAKITGTEVAVAKLVGYLRQAVAEAVRDSFDDPTRALREEADRLYSVLASSNARRVTQCMLRKIVPLKREGRMQWATAERIVADYANVSVPCLIVWGAHDETVPVSMGYKLAAQIPMARLRVIANCKHSPNLEAPAICARLIRDFAATRVRRRHAPVLCVVTVAAAVAAVAALAGRAGPPPAELRSSGDGRTGTRAASGSTAAPCSGPPTLGRSKWPGTPVDKVRSQAHQ